MDKKVYINTRVLVFLYAFSHQAALSLHRSNNATWKEVKDFYNDRIMPERLIPYLSGQLNRPDNFLTPAVKDSFIFSNKERLAYWFLFRLFRGPYLLEGEMIYYIQLLKELQAFLTAIEVNPHKVADLGRRFSLFIDKHLQWRLQIKDQEVAMKVDHFFANERLITTPLEQFMIGLNF